MEVNRETQNTENKPEFMKIKRTNLPALDNPPCALNRSGPLVRLGLDKAF